MEGASDDLQIKCSDTVMRERLYRREANITITVRIKCIIQILNFAISAQREDLRRQHPVHGGGPGCSCMFCFSGVWKVSGNLV